MSAADTYMDMLSERLAITAVMAVLPCPPAERRAVSRPEPSPPYKRRAQFARDGAAQTEDTRGEMWLGMELA